MAQLDLARRLKLPVIIHSRDAAKDTLDIMKAEHGSDIGGVIHCFSYTKEMAREYLDMGFFLGIGGVLTFKNARKLVQTVEAIPLSAIVLETDCPYMAPEPHRGTRNDSRNIPYVIEKIAKIMLPKDYLAYKLSGSFCTDVSDASGMLLMDCFRKYRDKRERILWMSTK